VLGCGIVNTGGGTGPNDQEPTGIIVATGNLSGLNGQTVSGAVTVYKANCGASTCEYIVRLAGLSAPTGTTLKILATTQTGTLDSTPTLTFYSGNKNYSFGSRPVTISWSRVDLQPTTYANGVNIFGTAPLVATAH